MNIEKLKSLAEKELKNESTLLEIAVRARDHLIERNIGAKDFKIMVPAGFGGFFEDLCEKHKVPCIQVDNEWFAIGQSYLELYAHEKRR